MMTPSLPQLTHFQLAMKISRGNNKWPPFSGYSKGGSKVLGLIEELLQCRLLKEHTWFRASVKCGGLASMMTLALALSNSLRFYRSLLRSCHECSSLRPWPRRSDSVIKSSCEMARCCSSVTRKGEHYRLLNIIHFDLNIKMLEVFHYGTAVYDI